MTAFAVWIAGHWVGVAAVGVFGLALGLLGLYGPPVLAAWVKPRDAQPDLTDEDEDLLRLAFAAGVAISQRAEELGVEIDVLLWEDELAWPETEEA